MKHLPTLSPSCILAGGGDRNWDPAIGCPGPCDDGAANWDDRKLASEFMTVRRDFSSLGTRDVRIFDLALVTRNYSAIFFYFGLIRPNSLFSRAFFAK